LVGTVEYEIPTWSQIYDLLLSQAQKLRASGYRPEVLVGIIRGGLIPARVLTDLLEAPQLATIQIEFYIDIARVGQGPVLKQGLSLPVNGKRVLVIDDIADSGKSLQLAQSYLFSQGAKEIRVATLYYKHSSIIKPDYYEKETCRWVIFPWETRETLREILQVHKGKRQINQEITKLIKAGLPQHLANTLLADMQEHP
jgi:hypoxanthine phosphoribosyltransferase